mgnify:CR=1 FL=1
MILAAGVASAWGFNFLVIDWGMPGIPPLLFVAIRFALVAAFAVVAYLASRSAPREELEIRGRSISSEQAQVFTQGAAAPVFDVHVFLAALVSTAFLRGAALTLVIAVLSHLTAIVISIPIALRLNAARRSPLGALLTAYVAIFRGAPTLLQLLFIWNALKFLVNGPITLIILIRARRAERRQAFDQKSAAYAMGGPPPVLASTRG